MNKPLDITVASVYSIPVSPWHAAENDAVVFHLIKHIKAYYMKCIHDFEA